MTAATKPLPPHGTRLRYRAGCHKECCLAADRAYNKRLRTFGTLKSQPDIVLPHLRKLLGAGASIQSIAAAADCDYETVQQIINGTRASIWQSTRDRLLAVENAELTAIIPAVEATRQVRALIAAGHPVNAIAEASGLNRAVVSEIANGHRETIRAASSVAMRNAYAQLATVVGTSIRSANRAARNGWAPPAAWDGIDMSDPDAFPDFTGYCGTTRGYWAHRSSGIPRCQPCRDAESEAERERKARRAIAARQELAA